MDAYIDPTPTSSGALRTAGPYAPCRPKNFYNHLLELTLLLEQQFRRDGCYVVWGALCNAQSSKLKMAVLGEPTAWVPNLALRTSFFRSANVPPGFEDAEWQIDRANRSATHRAGVGVHFSDSGNALVVFAQQDADLIVSFRDPSTTLLAEEGKRFIRAS